MDFLFWVNKKFWLGRKIMVPF